MAAAQREIGTFPGGSKSRVNRAGDAVRSDSATAEDLQIIDEWRTAHKVVLNTFQAILRYYAKRANVVIGQRHKRKKTIYDKLTRLPSMQLARMDDVAGCRLIFESITELNDFRAEFHKANFRHVKQNAVEKYDYIASPKATGYRGIHDVYSYDVKSVSGARYKGLLIELQYRTFHQHAWATAVEIVGFITASEPKFQRGDHRYEEAMSYASEIVARAYEGGASCHGNLSNQDVVNKFRALDGQLGLMSKLSTLSAADREITKNRNIILIFGENEDRTLVGSEGVSIRSGCDAGAFRF
jgi:putative GTP pyrophosphokinase